MFEIRLLLVVAGGAAALWSIRRWRQAVRFGLVLLIFEGALRKWVFPGAQDLIYFAKDVFFLGSYIGFLSEWPRLRVKPPLIAPLNAALVVAALWGLLEVLNPNLPNLLVGILGFKAYFFYAPLLFVLPAAFDSDADLARFLRRYAVIATPVGLLAVAQFFSPAGSALNAYAWGGSDTAYIATFGTSEFVRVTGTFSFITGFTSYLQATAVLCLALLGVVRWRMRGNLLLYLATGMVLLGMMMSGSRGPVLMLCLIFPFYWWLAVAREGASGATFGRLLLGVGLLAAFLLYAGTDALNAFYGRAVGSGASDVAQRLASPFLAPLAIIPQAGLLGMGIGSTHQTAMAVTHGIPPYSWLHGMVTEVETGRIVVEIGAIGFLLIYFLRVLLTLFALRQVFRLRTRFHRALATAAFLFALAQLPGGAVFDVTAGVFYWFFPGLLLTAMKLDQMAVAAARRAAADRAAANGPTRSLTGVARATAP
jgi:hypothetical protein